METINALLLAEFFTTTGYLDRLLFAFSEVESLHRSPRGKNQIQKLLNDLDAFLIKELNHYELETSVPEWNQFKLIMKGYNTYVEAFIKLPHTSTKKELMVIDYINLIYRNSFEIHNYILETSNTEVQFPRIYLAQKETIPAITQTENNNRAPLFSLDENKLRIYHEENIRKDSPLVFLEMRREEKYDFNLHKGHCLMAQKNHVEAKKYFVKARNYKETAEVLTLLAWSYSLLGEPSSAKDYCLQAVQLDSQYGPAYNDFGNYILAEGQVQESIRWFELAKRAPNYQNREYPYINAGRAYVVLKNYAQALTEFSLALAIAPHHQELHESIAKLKMNLEKSKKSDYNPNAITTSEKPGLHV